MTRSPCQFLNIYHLGVLLIYRPSLNMFSNYNSPDLTLPTPSTCYFSIVPSSSHFSVETPTTSTLSTYLVNSCSDPAHPLLAYRSLPTSPSKTTTLIDAAKLLQMQTTAAHTRASAQPMRHSTSSSSNNSNSNSSSGSCSPSIELMVCCSRCRRSLTSRNNMVQFGTNLYYCRHCASMTGFSHG
jgi:hypothetical protein